VKKCHRRRRQSKTGRYLGINEGDKRTTRWSGGEAWCARDPAAPAARRTPRYSLAGMTKVSASISTQHFRIDERLDPRPSALPAGSLRTFRRAPARRLACDRPCSPHVCGSNHVVGACACLLQRRFDVLQCPFRLSVASPMPTRLPSGPIAVVPDKGTAHSACGPACRITLFSHPVRRVGRSDPLLST
jgi:hypothetical protein